MHYWNNVDWWNFANIEMVLGPPGLLPFGRQTRSRPKCNIGSGFGYGQIGRKIQIRPSIKENTFEDRGWCRHSPWCVPGGANISGDGVHYVKDFLKYECMNCITVYKGFQEGGEASPMDEETPAIQCVPHRAWHLHPTPRSRRDWVVISALPQRYHTIFFRFLERKNTVLKHILDNYTQEYKKPTKGLKKIPHTHTF